MLHYVTKGELSVYAQSLSFNVIVYFFDFGLIMIMYGRFKKKNCY